MRGVVLVAVAALVLTPAEAATPLQKVRVSSDVATVLSTATLPHEGVAEDNLAGTVTLVPLGPIPAAADLDAYQLLPDGAQLLSFDTTVALPGGLTAEPCDVVRWDGASYTFAFQGRPRGIPAGVNVDAVAVRGSSLFLSFDVAVDFGNFRCDDADLVLFDGVAFSLLFEAAAAGVDPALDLDAADYLPCNGHLLLSFDGSGTLGTLSFTDADVLEFGGPAGFELAYRPAWGAGADLDAVHGTVDLGSGPATVFPQAVQAGSDKATYFWSSPAGYHAVRGALASVGSYTTDLTFEGTGTSLSDASLPVSNTGFWYLVKQSGCTLASWQSVLGAEPGRDAALP
ncbi:MAG TPA: hypothetical protein VFV75_17750 [Candidatus Polarisedimenticolaceae bacterium]|nr:hypothetical protein [Candidatus Polarisedimenticolaceae bacterium]